VIPSHKQDRRIPLYAVYSNGGVIVSHYDSRSSFATLDQA
jgi:hypothetical protein